MGHRTTRPQAPLRACRLRRYVAPFAVLAWLAGAPVLAQTGTAQVDRVIDDDTIRVRLDGARYTVSLTGVDTPETTHPTRGVEPDGPEAAAYTTARLTGATVRLDRDSAGDDIDAYGRLLRYVARQRRARQRDPDTRRVRHRHSAVSLLTETRLDLEAQARQARQGQWADADRSAEAKGDTTS